MMQLNNKNEWQMYKYMKSWGWDDDMIKFEIEKQRKINKFLSVFLSCFSIVWLAIFAYILYQLLFVG